MFLCVLLVFPAKTRVSGRTTPPKNFNPGNCGRVSLVFPGFLRENKHCCRAPGLPQEVSLWIFPRFPCGFAAKTKQNKGKREGEHTRGDGHQMGGSALRFPYFPCVWLVFAAKPRVSGAGDAPKKLQPREPWLFFLGFCLFLKQKHGNYGLGGPRPPGRKPPLEPGGLDLIVSKGI